MSLKRLIHELKKKKVSASQLLPDDASRPLLLLVSSLIERSHRSCPEEDRREAHRHLRRLSCARCQAAAIQRHHRSAGHRSTPGWRHHIPGSDCNYTLDWQWASTVVRPGCCHSMVEQVEPPTVPGVRLAGLQQPNQFRDTVRLPSSCDGER